MNESPVCLTAIYRTEPSPILCMIVFNVIHKHCKSLINYINPINILTELYIGINIMYM